MMQVQYSTRPSKLPFFQKGVTVVAIVNFMRIKDCEEWREGNMHESNWIFEQTLPPQFFRKVCKKGKGGGKGGYFRELTVHYSSDMNIQT